MRIEETNDLPASDPRHHTQNLERALKDLAQHAREDTRKVEDPKARLFFETTAELLLVLANACRHFGKEPKAA